MRKQLKHSFTVKLSERQIVQFIQLATLMGMSPNDLMQSFVTQAIEAQKDDPLGRWIADNTLDNKEYSYLVFLIRKDKLGEVIVKKDYLSQLLDFWDSADEAWRKEFEVERKKTLDFLLSLYKEYSEGKADSEILTFTEAMNSVESYKFQRKNFFKVIKE